MEKEDKLYCYYSGLPSPMAYLEEPWNISSELTIADVDRVIEMAWENRMSFDEIKSIRVK